MQTLWTSTAFAVALFAALPVLGEPSPEAAPPDPYVLPGYLPAGFSDFGTWTARRKTPLYEWPGSHGVVATIDKCEDVTAEDGEIRGRPREIRVLKAHPPFQKGERMWILARDLDEGYYQLWYKGEVHDELLEELEDGFELAERHCSPSLRACWLWFAKAAPQENWVRIKTASGILGWTNRAKDFSEQRADVRDCR